MPLSDLAIKTYTQPSCTLQIIDRSLPSHWRERSRNPQEEFELSFYNVELQEDRQVSIRGDRHQLAELREAVTSYVRHLLESSPERFAALFAAPTHLASETVGASTTQPNTVAPNPPEVAIATTEETTSTPARAIFLQPGNGLSHHLFLEPLATTETGQMIQLSMLQLSDLATVLDEYAADVLAAPVGVRSRRTTTPSTPSTAWASIAAMLLLAVGLTAGLVQLLNRSDEQETASIVRRSRSNGQSTAVQPLPTPQVSSPDTLPSSRTTDPSSSLPSGSVPQPATTLPGTPLPPPQTTAIPGITQAPPIPTQPILKQNGGSIPRPTGVPETSKVTTLPGITSPADTPSPPPSLARSEANRNANPGNTESASSPTIQQRMRAAVEGRAGETRSVPSRSPGTPPPGESQTTALATTPQLDEVKDYFQQNWTPPAGLSQTLEYSIVLDVDGTIQRIEPLGKAARTYVDRSSLPLIGERFVSPNPSGETPRIRVVLSPNGKVQTFLEPN